MNVKSREYTSQHQMLLVVFTQFMVTQIISGFVSNGGNLIDGIIVGQRLGNNGLAAVGGFFPISCLLLAISSIVANGIQGITGQLLGRGQIEKVERLLAFSLCFAMGIGVLFAIVCWNLSYAIAGFLGMNGQVQLLAACYIKSMAFGMPANIAIPVFSNLLYFNHDRTKILLSTITMMITDLTLDIFVGYYTTGNDIVKISRIGFASVISYYVGLFVLCTHLVTDRYKIKLHLGKIDVSSIYRFLLIGLPAALSYIYLLIRGMAYNYIISVNFDSDVFSAFAARISAAYVVTSIFNSIGISVLTLGSVAVGDEDTELMESIFRKALKISLIIGITMMLILIICPSLIASFFCRSNNAGVERYLKDAFIGLGLYIPSYAIITVVKSLYQCTERLNVVNALGACEQVVFTVGSVLLLMKPLGAYSIWISFVVAEYMVTVCILLYVWVKNRKFPTKLSEYMLLKDRIGVSENQRMNITIHELSQVSEVTKMYLSFCDNNNIDYKKTNHIGLCIEEMIVTTFSQNTGNEEELYIDVSVIYKDNGIRIRLRDNGYIYDPETLRQRYNPDDQIENVGVRLVYSIASKVTYASLFRLNTLIIIV